jgi:hypothetical protein
MLTARKPFFSTGNAGKRLCIAIVFVLAAGLSALAQADTRSVEGFDIHAVILRGSDELKIKWADDNRLLVKGDQDDLDRNPFYVRGKTLYLGYTESGKSVRGIKYLLETNTLRSIKLQGSGTIWMAPLETGELEVVLEGSGDIRLHKVSADELELTLAGSGNIQLAEARVRELAIDMAGSGGIDLGAVESEDLSVDLSGSGDVLASEAGSTNRLDIGLAGSGDIDLRKIRSRRADVGIAGSGDVFLWVEELLDAGIIGSGDVHYRGEPKVDASTMGSGEVSRID